MNTQCGYDSPEEYNIHPIYLSLREMMSPTSSGSLHNCSWSSHCLTWVVGGPLQQPKGVLNVHTACVMDICQFSFWLLWFTCHLGSSHYGRTHLDCGHMVFLPFIFKYRYKVFTSLFLLARYLVCSFTVSRGLSGVYCATHFNPSFTLISLSIFHTPHSIISSVLGDLW